MVIIINGKGGCGKDTLIRSCDLTRLERIFNISSVDFIKKILFEMKIDTSQKTNKFRQLVSDLKKAFTEYNDLPYRYALNDILRLYERFNKSIIFVHIQEPSEIRKMVKELTEDDIYVRTLLIKRKETDEQEYENDSDNDVENYTYDYVFHNDDPLDISMEHFNELISNILEDETKNG